MKRMFGFAVAALAALVAPAAAVETNLKVIDLFVAYDQSAKAWLESQGRELQEFAQDNVDRMNTCLANSGLAGDFTFRLVGAEAFAVDTGAKTLDSILLNDIQTKATATGVMKQVWDRRDALHADLFSFVTGGGIKGSQRGLGFTLGADPAGGTYGIAESIGLAGLADDDWRELLADSYCCNVVAVEALAEAGDYTLAHEVAHNMGCGHVDPAETGWSGTYSFSCGRQFSASQITVMGYPSAGVSVVPYFSSPEVTCDGVATGDATHDNVRTLRNNYAFVAKYRASDGEIAPTPPVTPGTDPDAPVAEEVLGFTPAGAFNPEKAVAPKPGSPYVGAIFDEQTNVAGVVLLKVGKANAKKGTSKVSGSVVLLNGKKFSIKGAEVPTGSSPRKTSGSGLVIPRIGNLELTLGANGFTGRLSTELGEVRSVRTADVMGGLSSSVATFRMNPVEEIAGASVVTNCLPAGTEVRTVNGKWQLAKAASVKYVKTDDVNYELQVNTAGGKTNVSGLKLSYAAKSGTFKGGFTFFTDVGTADKPKLKKIKAAVTGVVVDGVAHGVATVKNVDPWPVRVE